MMNERQNELSVLGVCRTLRLNNVTQKDIDDVFKVMHWSSSNEVHVFSFVTFMFLFNQQSIPYYYLSDYPEKTVRVINTIAYYKNPFTLVDLLYLEYGENDAHANNDYLRLLVDFTLHFINRWNQEINPTFKMDHNLIVPDTFISDRRDTTP